MGLSAGRTSRTCPSRRCRPWTRTPRTWSRCKCYERMRRRGRVGGEARVHGESQRSACRQTRTKRLSFWRRRRSPEALGGLPSELAQAWEGERCGADLRGAAGLRVRRTARRTASDSGASGEAAAEACHCRVGFAARDVALQACCERRLASRELLRSAAKASYLGPPAQTELPVALALEPRQDVAPTSTLVTIPGTFFGVGGCFPSQ